ncbi:Common plant regulatory factor [Musa troglodytarum]|uniref:Common plant regulatory factor n=1 Tax=Musa troglodytarum TaxID=320322 RepID=A0A9E7GYC4_9LILI|nr:Common plant regulatory factor [Musa troglodytarum]URE23410.1 Common plant regulatory factor [Musa troglodytarum]
MASNEAATPPKSNKASSPVQSRETPANPPYPDWATMQAYYGHGMIPPPYLPGHVPHPYMWGPQPLIPPFGSPYTAIYPHGGVYSHASVPLSSHTHCQGVAPSPSPAASEAVVMATPLSVEMPAKSPRNKDRRLVKKLKGLDGLALSGGNGSIENRDQADGNSEYNSTEGSSYGSDGDNAEGGIKDQRKRRSEDVPSSDNATNSEQVNPGHTEETPTSSKATAGVTGAAAVTAKPVGNIPSSVPAAGMDIRVSNSSKMKAIGPPVPVATGAVFPSHNGVTPELRMQDERELKRERRKQSNRESARRSRLRKQAETEELSAKVETLSAENTSLKSEINCLMKNSDKLRLENSALMEELNNVRSDHVGNTVGVRIRPAVAENFISMIENQSSISRMTQQDGDSSDQSSGKLHQLLNNSPRRDAVAAS